MNCYRGSTTSLTDTAGNTAAAYTYNTYGRCSRADIETETIYGTDYEADTKLKYNGRDGTVTDGSGLYYMRSRYYSPDLMRFLSADTHTGSIKDPVTLNRYAYANGDPVNYIDPYGTSAQYAKVSERGHLVLDGAAFIPAAGNIFDAANGVWYVAEGDKGNAALSAASAVPVFGAVGNVVKVGKDAAKGVKLAKKVEKNSKAADFDVETSLKIENKVVNGYIVKVNIGQQNKHINGTNEYKTVLKNGQTKSIMYGDLNEIQKLLDEWAGTGTFVTENKERVKFEKVIGVYIDPNSGIKQETTIGVIHYSKRGAHVVPARPK